MARVTDLRFGDRTLWWAEKDSITAGRRLAETFQWLDNEQGHHRDRNLHHLRLYSNRLAANLSGKSFAEFYPWESERLRINIVQAVIDAAVSQIATNRPRAMPLTVDGDHALMTRAKLMGRFIDGQFHATQQYELGLQVFQDAAIYGTGFEKVLSAYGEVCAERVHPDEIVVDDIEARTGKPRTLYQYKEIPIEVALANPRWKSKAELIEKARLLRDDHLGRRHVGEPISVIEGWHLPSAPGAKDGRRIVTTSEGPLEDEAWTRKGFPFAVFRWKWPGVGFLGTGIAEEVASIQIELNWLLEKVQRLLWMAAPQVWIQKGAVSDAAWTNEEHAVRYWSGTNPPIFNNPTAVNPEYFNQINALIDRAFQITGISQLYAASQKPAGLNSGEAIKNYNDIQSARFLHVGQRYEQFHMDVAGLMYEEAREIEDDDYRVMAKGKRNGLEELRFKDVDLERDKYQLQVFPTAFLPTTPAGKMDAIEQFGKISPELQKYLLAELRFPDIENAVSVVNGPLELADEAIGAILDRGRYELQPTPYWNLELARDRATLMLARATVQNVPEPRLDLLRQFIDDCQALIDESAGPQPTPGAPAGAMPMAAPGAPPLAGPAAIPPGAEAAAPPPGA